MCGRTACTLAPDDLCKACKFKDKNGKKQKPDWKDAPNGKSYFPSYNIAPGSHTPVLFSSKHLSGEGSEKGTSSRVIQPMLWGLIPSWHKGPIGGKAYETNNCRAESMLEKMTYKVPLQKGRRCVILAEGFFEWKREKDSKQAYYIYFPENQELYTDVKKSVDLLVVNKEATNGISAEIKQEYDAGIKQECDAGVKPEYDAGVKQEYGAGIKQECDARVKPEYDARVKQESDIGIKQESDVWIKQKSNTEIKSEATEGCEGDSSYPRLLTMAGVFDIWKPSGDSEAVYSYSVITVESSPAMSPIHHRMPALLTTDEEIEDWLNFGDVPLNKASKLIRAVTCVQSHPVSSVVNNSRNNKPECVKKIDPSKPKKSAGSMFMSAWLSKGPKVKCEGEPPTKKVKVT